MLTLASEHEALREFLENVDKTSIDSKVDKRTRAVQTIQVQAWPNQPSYDLLSAVSDYTTWRVSVLA